MRSSFATAATFALWSLCACGSSSDGGGTPDASSAGDSPVEDGDAGSDGGNPGDLDATIGDAADVATGDAADAGDAGDAGHSCTPIPQADAGAALCPAEGGPGFGQVLVYPCGLPAAVRDLDGGASSDGGWALDGGHVFGCMTLCNDVTGCSVTPGAGSAVVVTCCP